MSLRHREQKEAIGKKFLELLITADIFLHLFEKKSYSKKFLDGPKKSLWCFCLDKFEPRNELCVTYLEIYL